MISRLLIEHRLLRQARRQLIVELIVGPSHGKGMEAGFGWKDFSGFLLMMVQIIVMMVADAGDRRPEMMLMPPTSLMLIAATGLQTTIPSLSVDHHVGAMRVIDIGQLMPDGGRR